MRDEEHQHLVTKESKSSSEGKSPRIISQYEAHQNVKRMKTIEKSKKSSRRQASSDSTKFNSTPRLRYEARDDSGSQSPMRVSAISRVDGSFTSYYNDVIDFRTPQHSGGRTTKNTKFESTNGRMQERGANDFPSPK